MAAGVFVTGGTGFVGSAVVEELHSRGLQVTVLSHRNDAAARIGVRTIKGGLADSKSLDEGMAGCSAVIHLVGIIKENPRAGVTFQRIHVDGARAAVDAARRNGVRRFVHMSALGARPGAASEYHRTKYAAEQYLRESGLEWTILRPSLIHGPGGEFMRMEAKWARGKAPPFLFMPYFGAGPVGRGGAGRLQPVFVKDVARAFVDALDKPETIGEVYPLGGSEQLTWPEMHRRCAQAITGKLRPAAAIPAWWANALTHVIPGGLLPFNRDQIVMSQEDNTCDLTKFKAAFGWEPQPFTATLATYAKQL